MPSVPKDTHNPAPMAEAVEKTLPQIAVSAQPVMICGVNRKINIGNFETIDVYAGVSLPIDVDPTDRSALEAALQDAATRGFELVSREANSRYRLIKELQQNQSG